jgi:hypothetical protein
MTAHEALAELLLAYSQRVGVWTPDEVSFVARCRAALENDDAVEPKKFSEAQQEAYRQGLEAGRQDRERHPQEDWEGGPGNSRR